MGEDFLLTPYQLKTTNLIFNEHRYLLRNDSLYRRNIANYKSLVNVMDSTITYKDTQLKSSENMNRQLQQQNKKLSKLNYLFGGMTIIAILCSLVR